MKNIEFEKALFKLNTRYAFYTKKAQEYEKSNVKLFIKYSRLASIADTHIKFILNIYKGG